MDTDNMKLIPLAIAVGMIAGSPVHADVERRQVNAENLIVEVTDDAWQPEEFINGRPVPAVYLGWDDDITVDGVDDEAAWRRAIETDIPLSWGNVANVSIKALYTDEEVFIRVRWADDDENREHHPWVWDPAQAKYVESPSAEDSVLLSFEAGCEWNPSLLGGYVYDFDGWHWMAGRSDPLGQAVDLYGSVQDSARRHLSYAEYESRVASNQWNLKFVENNDVDLHADWNELDRVYMMQPAVKTVHYRAVPDGRRPPPFYKRLEAPQGTPYPRDESERFPQFSPVKLKDGAGEVSAKGQWRDGYWTVEFRRVRVTPAGTLNDTVFQRLTQFSIHVFDQTEAVDRASESGRLFLRFLPEGGSFAEQEQGQESLAER